MSDLHERPDPVLAVTRRRPGESDEQLARRLRAIAAELFVKHGRSVRVDVEPDPVRVDPERHEAALHVAAWAARRLGWPQPELNWFSRHLPMAECYHAFFVWSWDVTGTVRRAPTIWLNDALDGWMLVQAVLHEMAHADSDARGLSPLEDEHTAEPRTERLLAAYTAELRALPAGGDLSFVTSWMSTAGILGGSGLGAAVQVVGLSGATFAVLDIQGAGYESPAAGPAAVTSAVAGIPPAGNTTWVPVGMTVRILVGGTLRVRCLLGSGTSGNTGTAYWDDVRLKKQAASIQIGGYRANQTIDDSGNLYVPSAQDILVGTAPGGPSGNKPYTVRYPARQLIDEGGTGGTGGLALAGSPPVRTLWSMQCSAIVGTGGIVQHDVAHYFSGLLFLPKGVTIVAMRFLGQCHQTFANDWSIMNLQRDGTVLLTLTQAQGGGSPAIVSASISGQLVGDQQYTVGGTIGIANNNGCYSEIEFFEIDYTRTNMGKTY